MKLHHTLFVVLLLVAAGLLGLIAKVCKPIAPFVTWLLSPWALEFDALTNRYLLQYSVKVRNAQLDAVETQIGTSPVIELRDADPPATCAAAPSGNLIAIGTLPSDWLAAAAAGAIGKNGAWTLTGVLAGGTARSFRIYRAGSPSECDMQGTVGPTGSPTYDMGVDNVSVANAQVVTITGFTITRGNA